MSSEPSASARTVIIAHFNLHQGKLGMRYWKVLVGFSLSFSILSAHAAECDAATSFVEGYYESLSANKTDEVLEKWYSPPPEKRELLRELVPNIEFARLEKTKLVSCVKNKATVMVDVVVKPNDGKEEHWKGNINLMGAKNEWKIDKMDLKKGKSVAKKKKTDDADATDETAEQ